MNNTVKDVVTDKIIGKASAIVGKGVRNLAPEVAKQLNQTGNKMVLSNNKATKIMEKMPGVSDVKTARKTATSPNGLVDASKTVGRVIKKAPEAVVETGLKITKDTYENKNL